MLYDIDFNLIYQAVRSGNWRLIAAACLIVIVWALRRWGAAHWAFLASDRGGALLALLGGVAGAFMNALAAGADISIVLILDGLSVGLTAAGGFVAVKKIFGKPVQPSAPPAE